MNKGLYKHRDGQCIYWYETWKNSSENSGASIDIKDRDFWTWDNWSSNEWGLLVGAACLAQW